MRRILHFLLFRLTSSFNWKIEGIDWVLIQAGFLMKQSFTIIISERFNFIPHIPIRASSRRLGQCPIFAKRTFFFFFFEKKGTKHFTIPSSIHFLIVLHQNKAMHNFHERG